MTCLEHPKRTIQKGGVETVRPDYFFVIMLLYLLNQLKQIFSANKTSIYYQHHHHGIRLVNGSSASEGRVEIRLNGVWTTVCDHPWDISDANVVCRQLRFSGAVSTFGEAYFGQGEGPILKQDIDCTGSEPSLISCFRGSRNNESCSHRNDIGVICFRKYVQVFCHVRNSKMFRFSSEQLMI